MPVAASDCVSFLSPTRSGVASRPWRKSSMSPMTWSAESPRAQRLDSPHHSAKLLSANSKPAACGIGSSSVISTAASSTSLPTEFGNNSAYIAPTNVP